MSFSLHPHELAEFIRGSTKTIADEYQRIQRRTAEDPGTAGDEGEENWAALLRSWLPSTYTIVTKGRILSDCGLASPQIDVLVLRPSYPPALQHKKMYLAAGVAAAFECKLTLKNSHLSRLFETAAVVSGLSPRYGGTPFRDTHSPIFFGLLAHSHSWRRDPLITIDDKITALDEALVTQPRHMPDLLCIGDLGTWFSRKSVERSGDHHLFRGIETSYLISGMDVERHTHDTYTSIIHSAGQSDITPVSALLTRLLYRLAWDDHALRGVAQYFKATNVAGCSISRKRRAWPVEALSERTISMASHHPPNPDGFTRASDWTWDFDLWNEWHDWF